VTLRHGVILLAATILVSARPGRGQRAAVPPPGLRLVESAPALGVVCLDPGHPSENNSGRAVQHGVTEVEMNWLVAMRMKALLEQANVKVVLTKASMNQFVTNQRRAEAANAARANLFLRLHCDTGKGSGITFYYPNREGKKGGVRGPSAWVRAESERAARIVHDAAVKGLQGALPDNGAHGDDRTRIGGKQGALTGSIYARTPVVLVEMVYLSKRTDAAFIRSSRGREAMARSLTAGVLAYLTKRAYRNGPVARGQLFPPAAVEVARRLPASLEPAAPRRPARRRDLV